MPAGTEVPELIMQLMRGLNKGGVRTVESPELSAYMNQALLGHANPNAPAQARANIHDIMGDMAPTSSRPPPISRDPWFDQLLEPQASADPSMSIDEVRNLGRPPSPGGFAGQASPDQQFLWVVKNGKKTRVDGPFNDDISAAKALKQWRELATSSGTDLQFEIGPMFDPR